MNADPKSIDVQKHLNRFLNWCICEHLRLNSLTTGLPEDPVPERRTFRNLLNCFGQFVVLVGFNRNVSH